MQTRVGCALMGFRSRLAGRNASDLCGVLSGALPRASLRAIEGAFPRRRVYTAATTFWGFLAQVLSPSESCRETVRRVQARRLVSRRGAPSPRTGAYCQARRKLPLVLLKRLWQDLAAQSARQTPEPFLWLGLRVGVVDGSSLSAPDTVANQRAWPQSARQRPGCGFPWINLVTVFSLATGTLVDLALGSKHRSEQRLLSTLWTTIARNFDVLLGDRLFGSFATFCELRNRRLHGVFHLHQARPNDWRYGRRLGPDERLVVWTRPPPSESPLFARDWPASITIRIVRVRVAVPGFRTRSLFLSTDLLDPVRVPAAMLAALYLRRWRIELFLSQIKTAMNMDVLRCRTPPMVRREIHMHVIAYNLIRHLMLQAATFGRLPIDRISFKGTCDSLRAYCPSLAHAGSAPVLYRRLVACFFRSLAADYVPLRPDRSEPRAVKRRPKNYSLLTQPRNLARRSPLRHQPRNTAN
jgi:hypothetical protein